MNGGNAAWLTESTERNTRLRETAYNAKTKTGEPI